MAFSLDGPNDAIDEREDDHGRDLCGVFIDALRVTGASISVVNGSGHHSIVGASDALAAEIEARQFELGVGPHWDALRTQRPVFLYDLAEADSEGEWPTLSLQVARLGARSLYAFPLRLGAATVGVADLYSSSPSSHWPAERIALAGDIADKVSAPAVRLATRSAAAETARTGTNAVELRREVHQATGMAMAQLGTDAETALLRLRAFAFASGASLESVARDVVKRRLDLSDE